MNDSDLFMIDFGGYLASGNENSLEWIELKPQGDVPLPRWGHSCVSDREAIYVFG